MNDTQNGNANDGWFEKTWGEVVYTILIRATPDYIVFIDKDGDVDWETTTAYDNATNARKEFDSQKHNAVLHRAALLEATPCEGCKPPTLRQFKRLVAEAIAFNIALDYSGAEQTLDSAELFIRSRNEETSRFWYLHGSFWMAAAFAVTGYATWVYRDYFSLLLTPLGMWLALSAAAGAIGALLSVIWRSGKLKLDTSAGSALHYMEAVSRIWAGALSGFLVALAIKCELLLTAFAKGENKHGIMILAALAAGTGERMAGSIISKFESQDSKGDSNTKTDSK